MRSSSFLLNFIVIVFFWGCVTTTPNCGPEFSNLGYVEVENVLDRRGEKIESKSECETGDILELSDGDLYECKERIPLGPGVFKERFVLLWERTGTTFKKGVTPQCAGGYLATICRYDMNNPRHKSNLLEKGYEEPFILEQAFSTSSTYFLASSNNETYLVQRKNKSTDLDDYLNTYRDSDLAVDLWMQNLTSEALKGTSTACFFKDAKGNIFNNKDFKDG